VFNNKGYRPEEALKLFGPRLPAHEHTEIHQYQRVWFVGSQVFLLFFGIFPFLEN
jgi:hypothetical protein